VNNLHIITLYKLHNKLKLRVAPVALVMLNVSSSTCRVCLAVLFDKLDRAKLHGLDTSNVSSRVVSRHDEPSGIWAIDIRQTTTNQTERRPRLPQTFERLESNIDEDRISGKLRQGAELHEERSDAGSARHCGLRSWNSTDQVHRTVRHTGRRVER